METILIVSLVLSLLFNLLFFAFILYTFIKGRDIAEYNDFLEEYVHFKDYEKK